MMLARSGFRRLFHTSQLREKLIPFYLADIGEGIKECEVIQWFVKEGDEIAEFEKVCEVQSDKAQVEITSRFTGRITKLHFKVGELAQVGKPLIDIDVPEDSNVSSSSPASSSSPSSSSSSSSSPSSSSASTSAHHGHDSGEFKTFATPAVRRVAKENNIDLGAVRGTGKDGRITKEDVLNFVQAKAQPSPPKAEKAAPPASSATPRASSAPAAPSMSSGKGEERREPIKGFKKAMVRTMNEAWQKIPHFGYCDEIWMNELMTLRGDLKELATERGIRLSFMPFFIKAASLSLREYPILNSSLTPDETELIYKGSHNIGVAMDTPNGLIVPNIKNVQERSIFEIAKELNRLQELGSKGQLGPADLADGTFTISNIGTIGGTYTKPIIVSPQVCIGAIGKTQKLPRFDEKGHVIAAHILNISWSADHRVIDGATMARFSTLWKLYLEKPTTMIAELK